MKQQTQVVLEFRLSFFIAGETSEWFGLSVIEKLGPSNWQKTPD